jgi:fatty acid desaturase
MGTPADLSASVNTAITADSNASPESLRTNPRLLAEVRRLSEVSEVRGLAAVIFQWLLIALIIGLWCALPPSFGAVRWLLYALAVIAIASRQHALMIMMHEGAHQRISRNRAWNDFVSDMFCSFPLGLSTELYRRRHLQHHQHVNSDQDPDWTIMREYEDWQWPKDQIAAFRLFAGDFLGLAAHKVVATFLLWSPARKLIFKRKLKLAPADRLRLITFCTAVVALFGAFHLWLGFFMFWLVPFLTAFVAISRLRALAEHMVVESEHELNKTRHVDPTFLERLIVAPLNVNYHLTHHLYPSVPFYRLPEMHEVLMKEEVFRSRAHLTATYCGLRQGVWAETTRTKSPVAA